MNFQQLHNVALGILLLMPSSLQESTLYWHLMGISRLFRNCYRVTGFDYFLVDSRNMSLAYDILYDSIKWVW